MNNRTILFATDVPFWQSSTGAEQRIAALHRFLQTEEFRCGVFFVGELAAADREAIEIQGLNVFESSSDVPPEKLMNRIRWYADATLNQARNWIARREGDSKVAAGPPSLTLADFNWPWAATRFKEVVADFEPSAIIFEYIKMSYLVDVLTPVQRQRIRCLLDTHDVLHLRAAQFFAHGFPHWLRIERQEEADVARKFDLIMAIQDQEAKLFRNMVDDQVTTITVGHAVNKDEEASEDPLPENSATPQKITLGYIGSKNFSNWQAIREFLNCAWPTVAMKNASRCELVIAGAICDWFEVDDQGQIRLASLPAAAELNEDLDTAPSANQPLDGVRLMGRIEHVEDFYQDIDVVINPVQFGTGFEN